MKTPSKPEALWNSGASREDFIAMYGNTEHYDRLEKTYGCECVPVYILHDYTPKPNTDPDYLAWRGDIGPGRILRNSIQHANGKHR